MSREPRDIALAYIDAVGGNRLHAAEELLHPDVEFTGPTRTLHGRAAYLEALRRLTPIIARSEVRRNFVEGNDSAGIGVIGWCTATSLGDPSRNCTNDPPIADPASNDNLVALNWLRDNGANPPPLGIPGVDILYLQVEPASGNCFKKNKPDTFTFFSSEPDGELPTDGC